MISVIIPTFNRATTIERSVRSVLNQTYEDLEVIIVDDCSTDNTANVIQSIKDSRIIYIKHDVNRGACVARNTGINNSHGEYIAFQDSDDSWKPNKLETQLRIIKKYQADICFCQIHRHNFQPGKEEIYPNLETGIVEYQNVLIKSIASTQTILTTRDIINQYKFDPKVKRMQDYDWIIRAGRENLIVFVKEAFVDVYLQNDSITTTSYNKLLEANRFFYEKYKYLFDTYPDFQAALLERIGFYETRLNMDARDEYKELFKLNGKIKYLIKSKFPKITTPKKG